MTNKANYEKLPLECALEESPQIYSLVNVYASEASGLGEYVKQFHEIASQLVAAHNRLTSTYQDLAKHLRSFPAKKYSTEVDPSYELANDLKDCAEKLSEMSSWEHILATQIADGVVYPLSRFIGSELQDISSLGSLYHNAGNDVERAIGRYSRCRKRDPQQDRHEAVEDVYNSKKNFHVVALKYYSRLNQLQLGREAALLQPILGLITAARSHHRLGHEFSSSSVNDDYISRVGVKLKTLTDDCLSDREDTDEMISSIVTQSQLMYYPQPPGELARLPPDTTLISKSGFLNVYRKYMGVMSSWERHFVFIEGGNLMSTARKTDVAGSLLLELEQGTLAHATDTDDRMHVFTVVTAKKSVILQALNDRERDEWMLTIERMAKEGGYVKDQDLRLPPPAASSSFLSGVSQFFAGKRLSGPTSDSILGISPQDPTDPMTAVAGSPSRLLRVNVIPKDAPIVFDILAVEEETQPESGVQFESDGSGGGSSDDKGETKGFSVHFLGCMKVNLDAGQSVVFEVMRRILAARAIHDMFSTSHLQLTVSPSHLTLGDVTSGAVRLTHPLSDVAFWAAHSENQRLVGYIVRTSKDGDFSCYVFEADDSGGAVCSALGAAARHAYAHLLDKKTVQEKRKKETRLLLDNIAQMPDKGPLPELSSDGTQVILDAAPIHKEEKKRVEPTNRATTTDPKPESDA